MNAISRRILVSGVSVTIACAISAGAMAQEKFPSHPIQVVVGANPGGGIDSFTRILAELIEPALGQKLVVENKPGGGGTIGMALAAKAKPDGYTLVSTWSSPVTATVHSLQVPYTTDDFQPIIRLSSGPYVFCVRPDFPADNAKDFLAHLKAKPNEYVYGNDGVGGTAQLAAERIFKVAGIKQRTLPFSGALEVAKNLLGGYLPIYIGSILPIKAHVEAGKAKCLLLTSAERNAILPKAEGLKDVGLEKAETVLWRGVFAPKGVPTDRVASLEKAFRQAAESPKFKGFVANQGETLWLGGPDDLRKLVRSEYAVLGEVSADLGLKKK